MFIAKVLLLPRPTWQAHMVGLGSVVLHAIGHGRVFEEYTLSELLVSHSGLTQVGVSWVSLLQVDLDQRFLTYLTTGQERDRASLVHPQHLKNQLLRQRLGIHG
jgi:hypothetical protein